MDCRFKKILCWMGLIHGIHTHTCISIRQYGILWSTMIPEPYILRFNLVGTLIFSHRINGEFNVIWWKILWFCKYLSISLIAPDIWIENRMHLSHALKVSSFSIRRLECVYGAFGLGKQRNRNDILRKTFPTPVELSSSIIIYMIDIMAWSVHLLNLIRKVTKIF